MNHPQKVLSLKSVPNNRLGLSLFSCAGIGDLGFRAGGVDFVALAEFEPDRAALAALNFPGAKTFVRDIGTAVTEISAYAKHASAESDDGLFLITCTAPCQGMSKSGQGTLLRAVREGRRPKLDPRNRLILPALRIMRDLRPRFAVFENVCEMRDTVIEDDRGAVRPILEIVQEALGSEYVGTAYDVEMANYGVPQRRKRLITVYTRDKAAVQAFRAGAPLIPEPTHALGGSGGLLHWVSVMEALKGFPPLDAQSASSASCESVPFHRVPVLDSKKYTWIRHAAPGKSAFDNQCINPKCRFQGNRTHGTRKNREGINQPQKDTPLYCERCNELLPRPHTVVGGKMRIMSGYTSSYKRMDAGMPSPALTRNLSYPCSDNKVHPVQNRVLSLAEAFAVHTLDRYEYRWGPYQHEGREVTVAPDSLIRLVLGESIPPLFTELLTRHLVALSESRSPVTADLLPLS